MITTAQIAVMGANPDNADVPFTPPVNPWRPWHSPVMILAGTDGAGNPWLYLAGRCGWSRRPAGKCGGEQEPVAVKTVDEDAPSPLVDPRLVVGIGRPRIERSSRESSASPNAGCSA